jgi:hypothetical protein
VGIVDSFQGQERGISAITMTRSNPQGEIGLLSDIRRMNVCMTRAAQVVAGGRFVRALQTSVFCGIVGVCEGSGCYRTAHEMDKH